MEKYREMSFKSPEEELSFLREAVKAKEAELKEQNIETGSDTAIKSEIDRYKTVPKEVALSPQMTLEREKVEAIVLDLYPETHDKKMEDLLSIINEHGIKNAMSVVEKIDDPHIEDDFHRFLAEYIKKGYPVKGLDLSRREWKGLNMTLYEVILPEDLNHEGEKTKSLKEIISSMEQFLSGMFSVTDKDDTKSYKENYIVLEIANANGSDQFVFYVAVPNQYRQLFEKHIISVFHNAKVTENPSDYNIFNSGGVSLGSYLEASNNPIYEIKTYESFDHDPLNVVLNSFSKIQKNGEGAAIQIVFSPKGDYYNKKYNYAVELIDKGTPTKDAINLPETFVGSFVKEVGSFFKSAPKTEEKKPVDTEAIQKIKKKTSSVVVATNIRLIASAGTKEDTERILQSLESSFNQFLDPTSNGLKPKRLKGGKLQKLFKDFAFRKYDDEELLPLNLKEITTLFHFHTTRLSPQPQLKQVQSVSAPAPAEIGKEGILLGTNTFRNVDTPIYMKDEDRLRHVYTIGQTGTGKTNLLKNMIVQDIERGEGVCFIDPHGSDVLDILSKIPKERFEDVIYFDPSYTERPMALNMLEYDKNYPEQKTFVVNELFSIFQKLYGAVPESMGPMFEQYFRNATMLVIEDPESGSTLLDVSRVMSNKEFRQMKISRCKNPVVVQFWTEIAEKAGGEASLANIVPYITSKFDVFLANDIMRPIVAQERSSFNFRDIMDKKKILLVNLSKGRLGDINANLIGLILVGKILMAALSRVDIVGGDFPAFYLYIDEFQNITTDSISTILSEARKYKLSLNIAHQFIAQLDERIKNSVFGNVGSIVSFRVGAEDAEFLEKQFSPVFTAKDIMNIDNFNAYVKMLVSGKTVKAFNMRTEKPKEGDKNVVSKLKELSYMVYGGDRKEIEEEILKKYRK